MSSELEEWHARLDRHFADLRTARGGKPLFALEHALSLEEIEAIAAAIRGHIRSNRPSDTHGLPWLVYAAEIGYGYAGNEYWQTFEQATPGWTANGDREWIRGRYKWFHQKYGGAAPSGRWANQFSIICWPITHAILPADLQGQLARILYDLRDSFSAELFESPTTLGEFIAARSFNATSRFQNLVEEPHFIGQIATALLLQGQFGRAGLLHPAALQRIGADLDRERVARVWLHSARKAAQERATVRGLHFTRNTLLTTRRPEEARAEIADLGIEPRLVLRPGNQQRTSWEVCLEIPDLSHLLLRFPNARGVLAESRCVVAGRTGAPLPRGQFLYGATRVVLSRWPRHDEVLLQFERRDPQLDFLLRTECMLRPSPLRLFRIASDGMAYESRNLRVRPGESYIISRTSEFAPNSDLIPATLKCEGMYGAKMTLPAALSTQSETLLQQIGITRARTIEVWPAGLAAAQWDGEGHGEWLASERPCLGITTDHSVDAIIVSIGSNSESSLVLDDIRPGKPEFIELPRLPVGLHRLRFSARRAHSENTDPIGDLDVLMRIRESRPWSPAAGTQGPLLARIDPAMPTLEQLWEGRAEVAIEGPPGRRLRCDAALRDSALAEGGASKELPPLTLPVDASTWARHFSHHFCSDKNIATAYDTAKVCELKFVAEELGTFTLRCEREFAPLRWATRLSDQRYTVRLLNDSGDLTPPTVAMRTFESPLVEEQLEDAPTHIAPTTGGMYIARHMSSTVAIIVPPIVQGLSDLGCTPCLNNAGHTADAVHGMCSAAELWSRAKLSGNLFSATRQREVLSAIDGRVALTLCGEEWMRTERAFRAGTKSFGYIQRAVWTSYDDMEAGAWVGRRYVDLSTADLSMRADELAKLARVLEVADSSEAEAQLGWLAEFTLRISSDPASVASWSSGAFHAGFAQLQSAPALARAARCLVIAIDHHLSSQDVPRELYASWRWQ